MNQSYNKGRNSKASIRDSIERIVRQQFPHIDEESIVLGTVIQVYSDNTKDTYGTIDVKPIDGGPTIYAVRLNTFLGPDLKGSITFPKLYSDVFVRFFDDKQDSVVMMYSHVDKVVQVCDDEYSTKVVKVTTPIPEKYSETSETGDVSEISHNGTSLMNKVESSSNSAEIELADAENVNITANNIKLGNDKVGDYEPMALGETLSQLLKDLIQALIDVTVTTSLGPQKFINLATFTNLKGQVDNIKSAINSLQ